jgi:hypothetical protein
MSQPSSSRAPRTFMLVVAGMVVVALVAIFVVRVGGGRDAPVADPNLANIEIRSAPSGATVLLLDGGVLGTTPFVAALQQSPKELPVVVKLEGYQDHPLTVPLFSANGRIDTKLTRIGEDAAVPRPLPDGWTP